MLTATDVRALATHRGEPAVTSVYLDVDGRTRPVADDYRAAFARLADNLRHRVHAAGNRRLQHAVDADLDRMHAWRAPDLDRSATRGLALFSSQGPEGWFEAVELPRPLHDDAGIGSTPRVAQLLTVLASLSAGPASCSSPSPSCPIPRAACARTVWRTVSRRREVRRAATGQLVSWKAVPRRNLG